MKKTLTIVSIALVALMLTSCVENSKKYKELLAEKESLVVENANMENEYNTTLGIINDVENNLQAIRDAEGIMMMSNEGASQREQLTSELLQIKEVMAINRAKLDSVSQALDKSKKDRSYLRNTIKKLQAQIEEKEQVIASMQEQLSQKDAQIEGLNTEVSNLNTNLQQANAKNQEQQKLIDSQVEEMNIAYYLHGTKKQLKSYGITAKNLLKKNVPTDKFTKTDKRELNEIVMTAKKAVVMSSHPEGSYTIVKNGKDITLQITDPEQFWSVTKYLVIVTK